MAEVRPIDANALLGLYKKWLPQLAADEDAGDRNGVETCIAVLEDEPTLDYAPVRHGEWVWNGFDGIGWECSRCRHEESREAKKPDAKYCPNCGAKMDGGQPHA